MLALEKLNPTVTVLYFLSVAGIAMFSMNPFLLFGSLIGAVLLFIIGVRSGGLRSHLFWLAFFAMSALVNPLVSHNGYTVMFFLNDKPITLEATAYGIAAATAIVSVLYWFRSFTAIMTGDKLLYVFGRLSPRMALILSMGLRYVPMMSRQTERINNTQRALGLYKEDNIADRMRGRIRVFSVMLTWALENGIVTADSMSARGYGVGRRSQFSVFRFRGADIAFLAVTVLLAAMTCVSAGVGALDFTFYPTFAAARLTWVSVLGYTSYALLALLPLIIEAEDRLKWKYLMSRI